MTKTNPDKCIRIIEKICATDIGNRGIAPLANSTQGQLLQASLSIANHPDPHIAIVTGFLVHSTQTPTAETDGPLGATHLAHAFAQLNIPVCLISDSPCISVVKSAIRFDCIGIEEVSLDHSQVDIKRIRRRQNISHIIFIERVGPAKDGKMYTMNGKDMCPYTAPLHLLITDSITTIAMGDGGNEIGMGSIPYEIICQNVPHGEQIACTIRCDHLIVAGVSNWGAYALLTTLALLRKDWQAPIQKTLTVNNDRKILQDLLAQGAVDGISGKSTFFIDDIAWEEHMKILEKMLSVLTCD